MPGLPTVHMKYHHPVTATIPMKKKLSMRMHVSAVITNEFYVA